MQAGKNAAQSVKETMSNIGASAASGMEKTKATAQEKVDKMRANDPVEKDMATQRKEERINQAELHKQEVREHNAAERAAAKAGRNNTTGGTGSANYSTTGATGHPTGAHQMSAMPGHGTGQPTGNVTEGVVGSHPIGTNTGTGRTTAHKTHVEGDAPAYRTGGSYS